MLPRAKTTLAEYEPTILIEIHDDQMPEVNAILASYGYTGSFHADGQTYPVSEYAERPCHKGLRHQLLESSGLNLAAPLPCTVYITK